MLGHKVSLECLNLEMNYRFSLNRMKIHCKSTENHLEIYMFKNKSIHFKIDYETKGIRTLENIGKM